MEDVFAAEPLFEFDPIEHDSNTMDNNRKIVAESDCAEALRQTNCLTPDSLENNKTEHHNDINIKDYHHHLHHEVLLTPPNMILTPPNNNLDNTPEQNSLPKPEIDPDTRSKILEQIEFYFSDANVTKDKELAKQIRRNEMGYVSIKWITSFRKIQALTTDWKAVSRVLLQSKQLKVSADKKMVRRKHPIPKKSDQFADKTVMASNLPLSERSVECVKEYFSGFGKVTLVRFLTPGKPYPDDIANLKLRNWTGSPKSDMIAVEFDTVEAADLAVLKLSDSNNWRSSSQIQLLRTRHQKLSVEQRDRAPGGKSRKSSETVNNSLAYSLNQNCAIRRDSANNQQFARSLPKQMFTYHDNTSPTSSPHSYRKIPSGKSPQSYNTRSSFSQRSGAAAGSYGDSYSCSPSANSYLGQRLAMEKNGTSSPTVTMILVREPKGPDGTRGFGHKK